ncbi:Heavy metal-associated isoprenylated plant protein 6 [Vitis vinifera]|uniref:Heavy metal-associated isoprenylated plant protein 6 n=1 Tax=Vitis vinifera TaxID=29760 RepID=A0A438CJB7_VITVI|nr:Heavy metal-associated isoprenylated plant protein 6 [Vitis vinifera]
MGEAKDAGEKKADAGEKKADAGEKKAEGPAPAVFKIDLHCDGCAKKVRRYVRNFDGVEDVKVDSASNKVTVTGKADPVKLREKLEEKTKKEVALISPVPKKEAKDGGADKKTDDKSEKKSDEKKSDEKKADDKKPKETPVSTVVLKIRLHCDGCIHKIKKIISKSKGVKTVTVDSQKDLVTVTGPMDVKELIPYLKEKLRRTVEIVSPKKDDAGGDKKEKAAAVTRRKAEEEGGVKVEVNKMEYHGYGYAPPPQYYYGPPMYNHGYPAEGPSQWYEPPMYGQGYSGEGPSHHGYVVEHTPPPQIFSDENPNACSVM